MGAVVVLPMLLARLIKIERLADSGFLTQARDKLLIGGPSERGRLAVNLEKKDNVVRPIEDMEVRSPEPPIKTDAPRPVSPPKLIANPGSDRCNSYNAFLKLRREALESSKLSLPGQAIEDELE